MISSLLIFHIFVKFSPNEYVISMNIDSTIVSQSYLKLIKLIILLINFSNKCDIINDIATNLMIHL